MVSHYRLKQIVMERVKNLLQRVENRPALEEDAFLPFYRDLVLEFGVGRRLVLEALELQGWTLRSDRLVRIRGYSRESPTTLKE